MPQIAQQDYIQLYANDAFDAGTEAFGELWPIFEEKAKAGTLLDAIVIYDGVFKQVSRIVGYQFAGNGELEFVFIVTEGGVTTIAKPEQ